MGATFAHEVAIATDGQQVFFGGHGGTVRVPYDALHGRTGRLGAAVGRRNIAVDDDALCVVDSLQKLVRVAK